MKCLLKYEWVKLPRELLYSPYKGLMGHWARLASRVAFRSGKAKYCGYTNEVDAGTWVGGVVGLKSILGQKSRAKALEIMDTLSSLGYINYHIEPDTKKLTYSINDWVVKCSGEACDTGSVYATAGYGFLCLPRNITQRLVDRSHKFEDADAWLDLWCHTVYQDPHNAFSYMAPSVQYDNYGAALTLERLGQRWGWEKTKVWRFLQKHEDAFALHKLPGSYGCLIFNMQYPSGIEFTAPTQAEIKRILGEMRILGENAHISDSDNQRINRIIAWYSRQLHKDESTVSSFASDAGNNRVADSAPIIRAYISQCWNCYKDCWKKYIEYTQFPAQTHNLQGPCKQYSPRFLTEGGSS